MPFLIDFSLINKEYSNSPNNIDYEIYNYGIARQNYVILANKIDLASAKENLPRMTAFFSQSIILPVSALYGQGFKEVKAYVARNI